MPIVSRAVAFHHKSDPSYKTAGGLTGKQLKRNPDGEIVSKKASRKGKKNSWIQCVSDARKELGLGMVLLNDGPDGKRLYTLAKQMCGK